MAGIILYRTETVSRITAPCSCALSLSDRPWERTKASAVNALGSLPKRNRHTSVRPRSNYSASGVPNRKIVIEKMTQINPKEADAFFEIGRIRLQKGDREGARAAFRKASELDPSDADYKRVFAGTSAPRNPGKRINSESTEEEDTERTEERKEAELEQQRHR